MAITLRYTPIDTNGKATELSYQEMNENLKSFFYSSSFDTDTYTISLYNLSGSTSQSIDLSGLADTDSYITSASLVGTDLTFTSTGSAFNSTVDLSSLRTLPSAPLNSFQFNSGSTLGGSELYYLEVNNSVGLNTTTPEATFHVKAANNASASLLIETDSLGQQESGSARLDFRVADNENGYKKYAIIARNDGDGFGRGSLHFALDNTANSSNANLDDSHLTIQSDGKVLMPNINNSVQNTVIGYDIESGELTYYSTASFGGGSVDTGSLMVTGSVNSNTLTFTKGDGTTFALTVDTGSVGGLDYVDNVQLVDTDLIFGGIGNAFSASVSLSSLRTTPAGTDGQVQYNNGGAFGGSSGLTFNDTTQTLTVNSTLTNPTLKLVADGPPVGFAAGRVLADIQGESTTGLNAGNLQFALDQGTYSGTSLPTTFTIKTTPNGTVTPTSKLTIFNNGKTRLNEYGSGNFTGTATKWLAVDTNGNVIEEDEPSSGGLNIARPGSIDKNITFIEIKTPNQVAWDLHSTSGAVPPSGHVSTDSSTVSSIDEIKIHHTPDFTGGFSGDIETALDQLAQGGDITIADTADLNDTATATVMEVVNNGSYHSIYTTAWNSSGLTSLSSVAGLLIGFDTDKLIELDDKNYNRIQVDNDVANGRSIRFRANSAASAGDYYVVEITAASSNSNNMLLEYVFNAQNSQETYVESTNKIYYHNNAATLTQLNINGTYQQAIIEFRVTPNGNLALMGADKVLR